MAKYRTIAGVERVIYDSMEEFRAANPGGIVNLEWRKGREGDWVLGDDGSVMQVLKFGRVSSKSPREYIRTATGTFILSSKTCLNNTFKENIYSFSGRRATNTRPSMRERAFVAYIILGCEPFRAYMEIYRTENMAYAKMKAYSLLTRGNTMSIIRDSIDRAGGKTGATLEWAMKSIKDTVDGSANENVKLKGADLIAEYHGAKGKENVSPMGDAGSFQGFGPDALPEGETKQIAEQVPMEEVPPQKQGEPRQVVSGEYPASSPSVA